jgi:hypothetical protein
MIVDWRKKEHTAPVDQSLFREGSFSRVVHHLGLKTSEHISQVNSYVSSSRFIESFIIFRVVEYLRCHRLVAKPFASFSCNLGDIARHLVFLHFMACIYRSG